MILSPRTLGCLRRSNCVKLKVLVVAPRSTIVQVAIRFRERSAMVGVVLSEPAA